MRKLIAILSVVLLSIQLTSCVEEDSFGNNPMGNFEELWKMIDEQYCFLEYKEIDWDAIYLKYKKRIYSEMDDNELFEVLAKMLEELKDGHVNLENGVYFSSYQGWFKEYPANFQEYILRNYLKQDYHSIADARYCIIQKDIGYVHFANFSNTIDNNDIDKILEYLSSCKGLIIDVRNNGGGSINNANILASHFTDKKVLTGYILHKTGKGRNDFSSPKSVFLEPTKGIYWPKQVIVLTNRQTFSAANNFVNSMKLLPNVTLMGDITGGGSALPSTSELPNGWTVRFSTSPHLDIYKEHVEHGIEPDIYQSMSSWHEERGIDSIIENACNLIHQNKN